MKAGTAFRIPQPTRINTSSAIVHLHQGKPVTDSLTIAREFGRQHKNVLQSLDGLIEGGTIGRLEFKPSSYLTEQGKKQRMIQLTERGALIAMPFIGGKNSRAGQVRLVNAFLALRDELAGQNAGAWTDSRHRASIGYRMMADALQEARADDGKKTQGHHFANEARLVNWVLFGHFEGVDRGGMTQAELLLMAELEARNAILIARGRSYDERKAALPAYLQSIRPAQGRITQ